MQRLNNLAILPPKPEETGNLLAQVLDPFSHAAGYLDEKSIGRINATLSHIKAGNLSEESIPARDLADQTPILHPVIPSQQPESALFRYLPDPLTSFRQQTTKQPVQLGCCDVYHCWV